MTCTRLARVVAAAAMTAVIALPACDPGSRAKIAPVDSRGCHVQLTSNEDGFAIDMTLDCSGPAHTSCFTIRSLTCGGASVPLASPVALGECPGKPWCIQDCASVPAPGHLWDAPALLARPPCNTYRK